MAKITNENEIKLCKYCQSEIPKAAKVCPNCRKKQGGKGKWILLIIVIIIIILIIAAAAGSTSGNSGSSSSSDAQTDSEENVSLSEEDYKNMCESISYTDLSRTPDAYVGNYVTFTGEIFQVSESGTNAVYLISVTEDEYGFWDDNVWVTFSLKDTDMRFLEEDIVTFYGEFDGLESYEAVLGNEISVPKVNAAYIDLVE